MSYELLPIFVLTILVLAILPGPGALLSVARATSGGMPHAIATVSGIVVGDVIFILLVTLGLKYIAESLSSLFVIIKYAGSAYLIWLGLSLLFSSNKSLEDTSLDSKTPASKTTLLADFLAGIVVTLSNPKAMVFYLSFFPAFMDLTQLTAVDILVIIFIITTIIAATMMSYAIAAMRAQRLFQSSSSQSWVKRIAGTMIVATGGWLLARS